MEISNYVLTAFVYLAFLSISYGQVPDRQIIVIDPGHGGTDSGAIALNGIAEKDIVLSIAKKVDSLNTRLYNKHFDIYLTRYTDTLISLSDRTMLTKRLNADAFVSMHCNHSDDSSARGIEVYVFRKGEYVQESVYLAHQLQKGMMQNIGYKRRGVKLANFQVLRETVDYCPTVLLELGFLSNRDEAEYLTEEENILAIALSILSGFKTKKFKR